MLESLSNYPTFQHKAKPILRGPLTDGELEVEVEARPTLVTQARGRLSIGVGIDSQSSHGIAEPFMPTHSMLGPLSS